MKVNSIGKPLFVAEASAAHLDHFYPAVEAFCKTIADVQNKAIQNSPAG